MATLMEPSPQSLQLHYRTAPSSPRSSDNSNYLYYTSAPASPSRHEFSFDLSFGGPQFSSADELFEGGMLRPLATPNLPDKFSSSSRFAPFEKEESRIGNNKEESVEWTPRVRGRTVSSLSTTTTMARVARPRSLSPISRDDQSAPTLSSPASKKWRLKDLFLFRSASEGRATGRGSNDLLHKYSFVSSDINHNKSASSPHEKHYMKNREETKKKKMKTPLPFHQTSLFGYLRFNPAINSISKRFGGGGSNSQP